MFKTLKTLVMIAALLGSGSAVAHEGDDHGAGKDQHLMGSVQSIEANKLTVKGGDGKETNVHVDDRTQYENNGAPGKAADLKTGTKVVVHGEKMKDGTLHATKVRFGKAGNAKPAPEPGKAGAPAHDGHADHSKK